MQGRTCGCDAALCRVNVDTCWRQVSESCADEVRQHRRSFLARTQLARGKVLGQPVADSHLLGIDTARRPPRTSASSARDVSERFPRL